MLLTIPKNSKRQDTKVPVLPLPAQQCIKTVNYWLFSIYKETSRINSINSSSETGLWSSHYIPIILLSNLS